MLYPVKIAGFEKQNIEVKQDIFDRAKLLVNGQPPPTGGKRGKMLLIQDDGTKVIASWKSEFPGLDMPKLIVGGNEIKFVKPLKWYELLWCVLPIILLIAGGFIGVIIFILAVLGIIVNIRIFRATKRRLRQFVFSFATTISTVAIAIAITLVTGATPGL